MEFVFETNYDRKAMTAMARGLRKTVRKKHSRRSHILGWIVIALGLLLSWPSGEIRASDVLMWAAIVVMVIALLFEDRLNGYFARKKMLPGTSHSKAIFTEEGYRSETQMGNTEWKYENITAMAELNDYFVFLFSKNHAQVYDKRTLTGGTAEEFRTFIQEQTGKPVEAVKG